MILGAFLLHNLPLVPSESHKNGFKFTRSSHEMATPKQLPSGNWRIQVSVNGKMLSASFPTKTECKQWAAKQLVIKHETINTKNATFYELAEAWVERFGHRRPNIHRESQRIKSLLATTDLGKTNLRSLDKVVLAKWRDDRLKVVKTGTVHRDWNLLSSIASDGIEMGWLDSNPFKDTKKPPPSKARTRIASDEELDKLDKAIYNPRLRAAMRVASETGLSAGEICSLTWGQIEGRVITLPAFKTRPVRQVPLSKRALEALDGLQRLPKEYLVFGLNPSTLDGSWRKARGRAGIEGLTWHDLRATAATKLSKKLNPLQLAKVLGHTDLKMLIKVYYRESVEEIAAALD